LVFFAMSSIGLPGTNGFVSEFLTVLGAYTSPHLGPAYGSVAALGVILGAVYMLHMLARVMFGPLKFPAGDHGHGDTHADAHAADDHGDDHSHHAEPVMNDINGREIAILVPIAIAVILLGVLPTSLLKPMLGPVELIRNPSVVSKPVVMTPTQPASVAFTDVAVH
jgi:NADH-quinone oxidoreductase subunit M